MSCCCCCCFCCCFLWRCFSSRAKVRSIKSSANDDARKCFLLLARSLAHRSPRPIVSSAVGVVVLLLRRIDVVLLLLLVTATRIRTRTGVPWRRRFAAPSLLLLLLLRRLLVRVHAVVVRVVRHVVRHVVVRVRHHSRIGVLLRVRAVRRHVVHVCHTAVVHLVRLLLLLHLLLLEGVGRGRRLLVVGGIGNAVVRTVAA